MRFQAVSIAPDGHMDARPAPTVARYIREGRVVQLLQSLSAKGFPCCVQCGGVVPPSQRRRYREEAWFCKLACAERFAREVARQMWSRPLVEG